MLSIVSGLQPDTPQFFLKSIKIIDFFMLPVGSCRDDNGRRFLHEKKKNLPTFKLSIASGLHPETLLSSY